MSLKNLRNQNSNIVFTLEHVPSGCKGTSLVKYFAAAVSSSFCMDTVGPKLTCENTEKCDNAIM